MAAIVAGDRHPDDLRGAATSIAASAFAFVFVCAPPLPSLSLSPCQYLTAIPLWQSGKWHGGARSLANLPANRGFDTHFGFLKGGEDHFKQDHCAGGPLPGLVDLWENHGPAFGQNGTFSTWLYARKAVSIIRAHPDDGTPLFMYIPWHVVHTPLEAPEAYFYPNMFNNSDPKWGMALHGNRAAGRARVV